MSLHDSPKSRLDMQHGFMKIIVKNQVERDIYDREMKAAPVEKPREHVHRRKRPDRSAYVPPMHRPHKDSASNVLFHMEYEDEDQRVHRLTVTKDSDVRELTHEFCTTVGLSGVMEKVMIERVVEETGARKLSAQVQ